MKKLLNVIIAISILASPICVLGRPPVPRHHHYPTHCPPPPRHILPPRHCGGTWFAIGGITCLSGTVIRVVNEPPSTTVVYTQPQTVIVQPSVNTQQQSTTVEKLQTISKEKLKNDLAASLAEHLKNIPYSVEVGDFFTIGTDFGASITVVVSVGGNNYSISSGGTKANYEDLKTYLATEIINAVGKLSNQSSTTVKQIP